MRFFLLIQILCCLGMATTAFAQNDTLLATRVERQSPHYSRQVARVASAQPYTVRPNFSFTSVSLRIDRSAAFDGSYIVHRQDTFYLRADEHTPEDISYQQATLVVFDEAIDELLFYPASIRGPVTFSFFNADGEKKSHKTSRRTQSPLRLTSDCKEPAFVPVAEWRAGLPAPSYSRRITSVQHVIVHHSATYNTLTNYENVVRNIYLFHTRDRGWSDIGYNYLIAQDGTIFEGRSAGSPSEENDDVQGAHFCGKNSNTMGVCLLGNYSTTDPTNTAEPTDTAVASLVKLTGWKLAKEGLDPDGERSHPANPTLPTIAGHRDGCATECPGDNLYARLGEIRNSVELYIAADCETAPLTLSIYPVPAGNSLTIALPDALDFESLRVYDMVGRTHEVATFRESERSRTVTLDTRVLATGAYILHLYGEGWEERRRILVE